MATWRKRGKGSWQVRWRNPDGSQAQRVTHSLDARDELIRAVQRCEDLGDRWEPRVVREEPDFNALGRAWLRELTHLHGSKNIRLLGHRLDLIERWLRSKNAVGPLRPWALFSKGMVLQMQAELNGFEGHARKEVTCTKVARTLVQIWRWAAGDRMFADAVPVPEVVRFKAPPRARTRAVTWHQLDTVIAQSHGRHRKLLVLMRYTGLRVNQAMQLRWTDIEMERGILHVRPELGKSTAERVGREIPISPHLVAELSTWEHLGEYLAPIGDKTSREPRGRDVWRFWERAGVDEMYWRGRPHHAFRKALISCLKAQGIDPEAIEYYVGHDLEIRGTYTDPWALDLAAIAMAIPRIGEAPEDPRAFRGPVTDPASAVAVAWPAPPRTTEIMSNIGPFQKSGGSSGESNPPTTLSCRATVLKTARPTRTVELPRRR